MLMTNPYLYYLVTASSPEDEFANGRSIRIRVCVLSARVRRFVPWAFIAVDPTRFDNRVRMTSDRIGSDRTIGCHSTSDRSDPI